MGRSTIIWNGLRSTTLVVCLLVVSCLTVVDCVKLGKSASNTKWHNILPRSPHGCGGGGRCLNGGTCLDVIVVEFCICPVTHTGQHCERESPCNDNPCQNGGSCFSYVTDLSPVDSTSCFCPEGWSGYNCEIAGSTSCMADTCKNGGTCFTLEDYPFCDCATGFTGIECEHIEPCSTTRCPESHICVNILGVGHCVCVGGITDDDCVTETNDNNDCANNDPCLNGGICDDTAEPGFKVCRCLVGYEGLYCEKEITSSLPCNDPHTPCANGGSCQQYGNSYYCHCSPEYFGTNCTESIYYPLCLNYCQHGNCYIDESAPHCACTPGWEGRLCSVPTHYTTTTEAPVTIKPQCPNYCQHGRCYIYESAPQCDCTPGWEGRQCSVTSSLTTTKAAVLDCTLQCGDNGECGLKSNGDRYCRCKSGWNGDKCQNKEDIVPATPASGSSVGALIGGSVGGVFLVIIIVAVIVSMIIATRASIRRRQQSHSQAVGYNSSGVYDPHFGNENRGFVHAQATPNPSPLPANDLYGSGKANGSNMPRRTQNAVQNNYGAKDPSVIRNPASAYQYAYGAAPPARKTSRSSVPPESHKYAYISGDYQPLRSPTATGPKPPYSGAPSIAASAAPSVAASAEHTYQSLSVYGDTSRSTKQ